ETAGLHEMCHPMGEDAGLAAAGAGPDEEWPLPVEDGRSLAVVQAPEERVLGRTGLAAGARDRWHAQNSQRRFRSTLYSSSTSLPLTPAVTPRRTTEPLMNMISESPYSTDTSCSVDEEKPWYALMNSSGTT